MESNLHNVLFLPFLLLHLIWQLKLNFFRQHRLLDSVDPGQSGFLSLGLL